MNKLLSHPLMMALATIALLLAAMLLLTPTAATQELPPVEMVDRAQNQLPAEGCEIVQTLSYTRCSHSVVRRFAAPQELYGQTLEQAQSLYPDWQMTEFGPKLVQMEQKLPLFCPDHLVLMPDGAGMLCVFENKYGDALALVRELGVAVKELPAAAQEEVENGIGFDTAQEMDMWLESVES